MAATRSGKSSEVKKAACRRRVLRFNLSLYFKDPLSATPSNYFLISRPPLPSRSWCSNNGTVQFLKRSHKCRSEIHSVKSIRWWFMPARGISNRAIQNKSETTLRSPFRPLEVWATLVVQDQRFRRNRHGKTGQSVWNRCSLPLESSTRSKRVGVAHERHIPDHRVYH